MVTFIPFLNLPQFLEGNPDPDVLVTEHQTVNCPDYLLEDWRFLKLNATIFGLEEPPLRKPAVIPNHFLVEIKLSFSFCY